MLNTFTFYFFCVINSTILDQTNALNTQLQAQGSAAQAMFQDLLGKLYQQTLDSAKNFAQQLDAQAPAA